MSELRTAALRARDALALWSSGRDMDAVALNDLIADLEAALAEPVQEPATLKWLPAPRKTEWGFGMVSADVEIDRDHTLTLYCEEDQTAKVDAMFRRVFCKEEA